MTTNPSISPEQMNLVKVVCVMAWSDGELSSEEEKLLVDNFSRIFRVDETQRQLLRKEIEGYASQNLTLEELVPTFHNIEDKELALKLGYMTICASNRQAGEAKINADEKIAYRRLVEMLALPEETIEIIEREADDELKEQQNVIHALLSSINKFFHG